MGIFYLYLELLQISFVYKMFNFVEDFVSF